MHVGDPGTVGWSYVEGKGRRVKGERAESAELRLVTYRRFPPGRVGRSVWPEKRPHLTDTAVSLSQRPLGLLCLSLGINRHFGIWRFWVGSTAYNAAQEHSMTCQSRTAVVIWGAAGHASVVASTLRLLSTYLVAGFIDDVNIARKNAPFEGSKILGGREVLLCLKSLGINCLALGFGHCGKRLEIGELILKEGFELPSLVHPSATISNDVIIGPGTFVGAGVIVDPGCRIGKCVIINNGAILSHGTVVEDGSHVCPGVTLAGDVRVGEASWIGLGSSVIEKRRIGNGAFVGAGSVVTKDVPDHFLAYGVPARAVRAIDGNFSVTEGSR